MWLMTRDAGFLSVVEHDDSPDMLMVRARRRQDLLALDFVASGPIVETPVGDYRWRRDVQRYAFAGWLVEQVERIDYRSHAKEAMAGDDAELYNAYLAVWAMMHRRLQGGSAIDRHPSYSRNDFTWFEEPLFLPEPPKRRRRKHGRSRSRPGG